MSLYQKINDARDSARRDRDTVLLGILTSLKGEVDRRRTNLKDEVPDSLVNSVAKSSTEAIKECIESTPGADHESKIYEIQVLANFLPVVRSEEDTMAVVKSTIEAAGATTLADLGKVMGAISKMPGIDKGLANKLVKSLLQPK